MTVKKKEYNRLPGSGLKRGSFLTLSGIRASMWTGEDHLLCLYSTGLSEDYKRFYYRDIQAITTQQTPHYKTQIVILVLLSMVLAYPSIALSGTPATIFMIMTGLFMAFLIVHVLRGPTCSCYLYTAVSKEELPSLNRLKNAITSLSIISPLIEEVQGRLRPEDIKVKSDEITATVSTGIKTRISSSKTDRDVKYYSGHSHLLLFSILLLNGFINSADFFINHVSITGLSTVSYWILAVLVIMALVKQHGTNIGTELRSLTWITLGYITLCYIAGTVIYMIVGLKNINAMGSHIEMMKLISELSPLDTPLLLGYYAVSITFGIAAGMAGLVLTRKFRGR